MSYGVFKITETLVAEFSDEDVAYEWASEEDYRTVIRRLPDREPMAVWEHELLELMSKRERK
jgi:hypothetical protein